MIERLKVKLHQCGRSRRTDNFLLRLFLNIVFSSLCCPPIFTFSTSSAHLPFSLSLSLALSYSLSIDCTKVYRTCGIRSAVLIQLIAEKLSLSLKSGAKDKIEEEEEEEGEEEEEEDET